MTPRHASQPHTVVTQQPQACSQGKGGGGGRGCLQVIGVQFYTGDHDNYIYIYTDMAKEARISEAHQLTIYITQCYLIVTIQGITSSQMAKQFVY